jgi:hypothetical protein
LWLKPLLFHLKKTAHIGSMQVSFNGASISILKYRAIQRHKQSKSQAIKNRQSRLKTAGLFNLEKAFNHRGHEEHE